MLKFLFQRRYRFVGGQVPVLCIWSAHGSARLSERVLIQSESQPFALGTHLIKIMYCSKPRISEIYLLWSPSDYFPDGGWH